MPVIKIHYFSDDLPRLQKTDKGDYRDNGGHHEDPSRVLENAEGRTGVFRTGKTHNVRYKRNSFSDIEIQTCEEFRDLAKNDNAQNDQKS